MSKVDAIEPRAAWLSQSCIRVCNLHREIPLREGVERVALQLLRSIEADAIPAPSISSTKGTIRITWEHGHRTLGIMVIGEHRVLAGRLEDGKPSSVRSIARDRVQELRMSIAWIYPGANQGTVNNLFGWREQ